MAIGNVESCMSVFPNTHTWEQQEKKEAKEWKKVKKRGMSMKRNKAGTNEKISPAKLNYSSGLLSLQGHYIQWEGRQH